jgi:hypothetical protein
MLAEMNRFVLAHDRYLALDEARSQCSTQAEREFLQIEILAAYLEVQLRARTLAGMQYADGNDYAEMN